MPTSVCLTLCIYGWSSLSLLCNVLDYIISTHLTLSALLGTYVLGGFSLVSRMNDSIFVRRLALLGFFASMCARVGRK